MEKEMILSKKDVDAYKKAENIRMKIFLKIKARHAFIIKTIGEVYNKSLIADDLNYAQKESIINFGNSCCGIYTNIYDNSKYFSNTNVIFFEKIINKAGHAQELRYIPISWFFEDFKSELINGKKLYDDTMPSAEINCMTQKLITINEQIKILDEQRHQTILEINKLKMK